MMKKGLSNNPTSHLLSSKDPIRLASGMLNTDDRVSLLDGDATYYPHFITHKLADLYVQKWLKSLPWSQDTISIYGREILIPRMQAWLGEPGIAYTYSGKTLVTQQWSNELKSLADAVSSICQCQFNTVLANLYRNGNDSMGWHADNEPELGVDPVIASVTLGNPRDFLFRRIGNTKLDSKLLLENGSLLIMNRGMQSRWQHSLPKRKRVSTPRINLTFRYVYD